MTLLFRMSLTSVRRKEAIFCRLLVHGIECRERIRRAVVHSSGDTITAKLLMLVSQLDRMTLGAENYAEIDGARRQRRVELQQKQERVEDDFIPTPKTIGFNWDLLEAYEAQGWGPRAVWNLIIAQFTRAGLSEFAPEEIEVNFVCTWVNEKRTWFGK